MSPVLRLVGPSQALSQGGLCPLVSMPFAKSNWECEPPIPKNGFFEFGQAYSVRNVTLRKGDHRPCFLHGE